MTSPGDDPRLDGQIGQWRRYLRRRRAIDGPDVAELEGHLRDQVASLAAAGLDADEAFLVAVKRMGNLDELSREFAREHSDRLWKQLVVGADASRSRETARRDMLVAVGLGILAGATIKMPALFGLELADGADEEFYARNASLFAMPHLAAYFAWKRGADAVRCMTLALAFGIGALFANVHPFTAGADTLALTTLHLPIALWLAVGVAYVQGGTFAPAGRMDFVRFSGELLIYYALIALGGGVLTMFTFLIFQSIDINPERFVGGWLVPCGAMGAVLVASWLVEAKQSVIENMAPVLTRLFTPLFTLVLLAFLTTMAWTGNPINIERDVLIAFDLLLVLVVGLVLYAASARDRDAPPATFDRLQLLLVVSALIVDAVALAAIASRITEFGLTPNRVAALGENLILLVNLSWSAWLYWRFIRGSGRFAALERWQTAYLPVYSAWAAIVVILFPPLFGYR